MISALQKLQNSCSHELSYTQYKLLCSSLTAHQSKYLVTESVDDEWERGGRGHGHPRPRTSDALKYLKAYLESPLLVMF